MLLVKIGESMKSQITQKRMFLNLLTSVTVNDAKNFPPVIALVRSSISVQTYGEKIGESLARVELCYTTHFPENR